MKAVYETGSMLVDVVGRVLRRRPSIPRGGGRVRRLLTETPRASLTSVGRSIYIYNIYI